MLVFIHECLLLWVGCPWLPLIHFDSKVFFKRISVKLFDRSSLWVGKEHRTFSTNSLTLLPVYDSLVVFREMVWYNGKIFRIQDMSSNLVYHFVCQLRTLAQQAYIQVWTLHHLFTNFGTLSYLISQSHFSLTCKSMFLWGWITTLLSLFLHL